MSQSQPHHSTRIACESRYPCKIICAATWSITCRLFFTFRPDLVERLLRGHGRHPLIPIADLASRRFRPQFLPEFLRLRRRRSVGAIHVARQPDHHHFDFLPLDHPRHIRRQIAAPLTCTVSSGCASIPRSSESARPTRAAPRSMPSAFFMSLTTSRHCSSGGTLPTSCLIFSASLRWATSNASSVCTTIKSRTPMSATWPGRVV